MKANCRTFSSASGEAPIAVTAALALALPFARR